MFDLPGRLYRAILPPGVWLATPPDPEPDPRFPPLVPAGGGRDVRSERLRPFLEDPTQEGPWDLHIVEDAPPAGELGMSYACQRCGVWGRAPARTARVCWCCGAGDQLVRR